MKNGFSDSPERGGPIYGAAMWGNDMGDSVAIDRQESPSERAIRLIRARTSERSQAEQGHARGGQAAGGLEQESDGEPDSTRFEYRETDVQDRGFFARMRSFFFPNYESPPQSKKMQEAVKICSKSKEDLRNTISDSRERIVSMSQRPPALKQPK